jgi:hypothetical protein
MEPEPAARMGSHFLFSLARVCDTGIPDRLAGHVASWGHVAFERQHVVQPLQPLTRRPLMSPFPPIHGGVCNAEPPREFVLREAQS